MKKKVVRFEDQSLCARRLQCCRIESLPCGPMSTTASPGDIQLDNVASNEEPLPQLASPVKPKGKVSLPISRRLKLFACNPWLRAFVAISISFLNFWIFAEGAPFFYFRVLFKLECPSVGMMSFDCFCFSDRPNCRQQIRSRNPRSRQCFLTDVLEIP